MTSIPDQKITDAAVDHPNPALARPGSIVGASAVVSSRPVFLDLMRIQMPVGALTSIGHRISGVVLATSIPAAVYLLGLSLRDAVGFAQVIALFAQLPVKALAVIVVWALVQHILSGVRHLLTDFDIGSPMRVARRSAWFVNLAGVAGAVLAAGVMW